MAKLDRAESKTEFAARVGLTKGRISQLIAEGLPVRPDGRIDVEAGLAWMEQNLDPSRRNKGGAPSITAGMPSVAEVRRMLLLVQVQRARLAYDKERGDLIDAAAATATIFAAPGRSAMRISPGCSVPRPWSPPRLAPIRASPSPCSTG